MPRNWLAADVESQLLDEVAQRRRRTAALASSMRPSAAAMMSAYADAYPWMDGGAVQSLSLAGVAPDDPQVLSIADLAAQQAAKDGEFDDPSSNVPDPWYETLWHAATDWARPFVRTGFTILAAPMEEMEALLNAAGTAVLAGSDPGQAGTDPLAVISGLMDPLSLPVRLAGDIASAASDPTKLLGDFWDNYTKKAAHSGLAIAVGDLAQGNWSVQEWWTGRSDQMVDAEGNPSEAALGPGLLPSGPIYAERQAQKYRLTLDGEFVTPGRIMARNFTEPGAWTYQALSGLSDFERQLVADPADRGLAALSRARTATRNFQSVGLIDALRHNVDPERAVNHFLTSNRGRAMVDWLTNEKDIDTIWKATKYADLDTAGRLAYASTTNETLKVLSDTLGTVIREKPTASWFSSGIGGAIPGASSDYGRIFGFGARARRATNSWRWTMDMPRSVLNPDDINDAARQLDLWMRNARIPEATRKARIAQMAGLQNGDRVQLLDVAAGVMDDTKQLLINHGVIESRATRLTRLYDNMGEELRAYGFDALGRHEDVLGPFRMVDGGVEMTLPTAQALLASEMLDSHIPLPPSVREIKRLQPRFDIARKAYDSKLWKGTVDGLDSAMSSIWKPLQLLRGAYTVRVIGEEQIRMSASGLDTLFTHPASAIAWTIGVDPKGRLGRKLQELAGGPMGWKDVTGSEFKATDDIWEYTDSLSRGAAGHTGLPGEILTGRYIKAGPNDPDRFRGWVVELHHMHNDPVMRRLATGLGEGELRSIGGTTGNVVDDVKKWFWSAPGGKKFRMEWAQIHGREALRGNQEVANKYIDLFVDRFKRSTGGNTDLIDFVGSGSMRSFDVNVIGNEKSIANILEKHYADAIPNYVKKPEVISRRGRFEGFDRFVDMAFDHLMSKPTNFLSRSPTFRQKYWQRVSELAGFADEATQRALIEAANEAGIRGRHWDDLVSRVASAGPGTRLDNIDVVDHLAKGFALDETRKLLYDMQKRSQFFDMARIIFPFGEAWKEIIGAWSGIITKNPQVLRRFQQGLDGVRQPSMLPGATPEVGVNPDSGQGFFHPDPNTGEEVFTYPAAWVGKLLGVTDVSNPLQAFNLGSDQPSGVAFTGRAAGLNIVSATVLPGFGPVIQYPMSKIIPQTPSWDWARKTISPFGEQPLLESFEPAWLKKVIAGITGDANDPQNHRLFANTVADVQRHLLASHPKDYNISTQEGQQKLFDDAVAKGKALYIIRGIAQSTVPTGPTFEWTTKDAEGNVVPVKLLSDELRRMTVEEYNGDRVAAFKEWTNRFGVENVLAVVGKSSSLVERPVTEKGDDWLRANADLERDYETTIGYFAPEPVAGEFDYNAYLRQFETRAREALSPAEQLSLANDFLGRVQWEQAKRIAAIKPGPITSSWLAMTRQQIAATHPGFDGWVAQRVWAQKPEIQTQIDEMTRAVTHSPTLANTDAGAGIILYLSARQTAEQMVKLLPGNTQRFQQAKSAIGIRSWLRSVAYQIIDEHPDFARAWHGVFEPELAKDTEQLLGGGIAQ